jgi:hypothetical protein
MKSMSLGVSLRAPRFEKSWNTAAGADCCFSSAAASAAACSAIAAPQSSSRF